MANLDLAELLKEQDRQRLLQASTEDLLSSARQAEAMATGNSLKKSLLNGDISSLERRSTGSLIKTSASLRGDKIDSATPTDPADALKGYQEVVDQYKAMKTFVKPGDSYEAIKRKAAMYVDPKTGKPLIGDINPLVAELAAAKDKPLTGGDKILHTPAKPEPVSKPVQEQQKLIDEHLKANPIEGLPSISDATAKAFKAKASEKNSILAGLTISDVDVHMKSSISGQTIYTIKPEAAKRLGLNPNTAFNLPGDTPTEATTPSAFNLSSINKEGKGTYVEQAKYILDVTQKAREAAITAGKNEASYKALEEQINLTKSLVYRGDDQAKKDLPRLENQLEAMNRHIEVSANKAIANNPALGGLKVDLQATREREKVDATKKAATAPENPKEVATLQQATGLSQADSYSLYNGKSDRIRQGEVQMFTRDVTVRNGQLPSPAVPKGSTYMHLNLKAWVKQASEGSRQDPSVVANAQEEADIINSAYTRALDKSVQEKLTVQGEGQKPREPFSLQTEYINAAQKGLIFHGLRQALPDKYKAILADPDNAEANFKALGLSVEEARSALQQAWADMPISNLTRSMGISDATMKAQAKQQIDRLLPTSWLETLQRIGNWSPTN